VGTPQLNFLTLACADISSEAAFLRALGWVEAPSSDEPHRVFQGTNGVVVALYAAENYEPHFGPRADGFRGFTLGLNVATPEEVDEVYALLQSIAGVEVLEEPFDSPYGFRGFSARNPEGNLWDVAWKEGSTVTPNGALSWN
jgi:uncharacterized glyoxalase superfamily protein PhnB